MSARTVVHVTMWDSPYLGNFMHSMLALAAEVRTRHGLDTHLVLAAGAVGQPWLAELEQEGLSWSIPGGGKRDLDEHLAQVVGERDVALVHSHFTAGDLQAVRAARAAGAPCVWHMHTGFEGYPVRQRAKDLVKMRGVARRGVARIVAVSPWLHELALRRGGPPGRIVTVPNAIVLERFDDLPPAAVARAQLGAPAEGPLLLALAWWPEAKGADVLLDALELLAAEGRPVQALLVGEERLRELVTARGLDDAPWLTLSGFIPDPGVLFAAADLFVSASRHEGQSYAIGEALACGLPVITTHIPGPTVYLPAPGVSAVPTEDPAALAAAITARLAQAPPPPGAARAWMEEHLGLRAWAQRMGDVYAELL